MKKYILMFCVLLSACATIPQETPGYEKEKIEALHAANVAAFTDAPESCYDLSYKLATQDLKVENILNILAVNKNKTTVLAREKYDEIVKCGESFKELNEMRTSQDIEENLTKYFKANLAKYVNYGDGPSPYYDYLKLPYNEFKDKYWPSFDVSYPDIVKKIDAAVKHREVLLKADSLIWQYFHEKDMKTFLSRTGGRNFCDNTLFDFINAWENKRPNKKCLYVIGFDECLAVLSQAKDGVLFSGSSDSYTFCGNYPLNKVIYIHTKERYATGERIHLGAYIYTGLFDYVTVMGSKNSVHAFREYDMTGKTNGLYFYK